MQTTSCLGFSAYGPYRHHQLARRDRRAFVLTVGFCVLPLAVVVGLLVWVRSSHCAYTTTDWARNTAYEIAKTGQIFALQAHRPPTTVDELVDPPPPMRPYLESAPNDPWNHEFRMVSPAMRANGTFDVVSAGPDGVFYTGDDLGNWARDPE